MTDIKNIAEDYDDKKVMLNIFPNTSENSFFGDYPDEKMDPSLPFGFIRYFDLMDAYTGTVMLPTDHFDKCMEMVKLLLCSEQDICFVVNASRECFPYNQSKAKIPIASEFIKGRPLFF